MKIFLSIWTTALLILMSGCSGSSNNATIPDNNNTIDINFTDRSFQMGIVPMPEDWTDEKIIEAYELSANLSKVISLTQQLGWVNNQLVNEYENDITLARASGLDLIISVDILEANRNEIANLPVVLQGRDFSDTSLRQYYIAEVAEIVTRYQPEYLVLAVEINGYFAAFPDNYPDYVSLYNTTYDVIKNIAPETMIGVSFHYESMNSEAQWDAISQLAEQLDFIGLTTYPGIVFSSFDAIPENYYSILNNIENKPFVFTEIGWRGNGNSVDEREQAEFIVRFFELTTDVELPLAVWSLLHDWEGGNVFETMGLIDNNGRKKLAWSIWKQIYDLPLIE